MSDTFIDFIVPADPSSQAGKPILIHDHDIKQSLKFHKLFQNRFLWKQSIPSSTNEQHRHSSQCSYYILSTIFVQRVRLKLYVRHIVCLRGNMLGLRYVASPLRCQPGDLKPWHPWSHRQEPWFHRLGDQNTCKYLLICDNLGIYLPANERVDPENGKCCVETNLQHPIWRGLCYLNFP